MNNGVITPIRFAFRRARALASAFGTKPNLSMDDMTRRRVSGFTLSGEFKTREIVEMLMPELFATS